MRQDSGFSTGRHVDTPRFTTSALTLRSEETALRGQPRRLPRLRGKGGAAGRGAALHEVEFPIKRKADQTCASPRPFRKGGASLRPGRFLTTTTPARPCAPLVAVSGPLPTTMKRPYAASSPAFPARAGKAALFGRSPHRPPRAAARPPGGPVRGASGPHLMPRPCAAARPPVRWRGQARANDRGLARI